MIDIPDMADIREAAKTIKPYAVRTPLVASPVLDALTGGRVFLKAENLQRTGSFKFRGGYNSVSHLSETERAGGIYACSSGNHAQGVADAAALHGASATIVMPSDAPISKKDRTKRLGARVIEYDRYTEDRDAIVAKLAAETQGSIIHPYETFHVVAGQGTVGLEATEDMQAMGHSIDRVLVCAGGGGLMAGVLLSVQDVFPNAHIHPVEPLGHDDQRRSHIAGKRVGNNPGPASVCDAIVTPMPGELSFAICHGKVSEGLCVSDEEALAAVAFAFHELKLVVEPGGAVTLAALLSGKIDIKGETVVATLSGGNVDPDMLIRSLT